MHELTASWLWLTPQGLLTDTSGLIVLLLLITFTMMGLWRLLCWFGEIWQMVRPGAVYELSHLMTLNRRR